MKEFATVGHLLEFIKEHNIPMDARILVQRIEDQYYEGCDISGMTSLLENGTYGPLPEGSKATPWSTIKKTNYMKGFSDIEYTEIHAPTIYKDDNNLYLDLHY